MYVCTHTGQRYRSAAAWSVDDEGSNDIDAGAVRVSTGQYFAWNGETTIGYFFDDDDDKTPNSDCGFSGVLVTAVPKDPDYMDSYSDVADLVSSSVSVSEANHAQSDVVMALTSAGMTYTLSYTYH
jgi:hypothetical protein